MHRARRPWLHRATNVGTKFARRLDQSVRPVILGVSGLAALVVAGFQVGAIPGWIVVGLACFALEWRISGKSS